MVLFSIRLLSGEDNWICSNGQWVKHGRPDNPPPVTGCGSSASEYLKMIKVGQPQAGESVASPLLVTGEARGNWYFEAEFPVKLMDQAGRILAVGPARALGDWMTTDWAPFQAELTYNAPTDMDATLILERSNPSGLAENSAQETVPVRLKSKQSMSVRVFFGRQGENDDCQKVVAVGRVVSKTTATARTALLELLKGPTAEEKSAGFFTSINSGVSIQKLSIIDGIAKADFSSELERGSGGSCRATAIRSQITQTLKQFSTVKEVIISINGRTEDILQP